MKRLDEVGLSVRRFARCLESPPPRVVLIEIRFGPPMRVHCSLTRSASSWLIATPQVSSLRLLMRSKSRVGMVVVRVEQDRDAVLLRARRADVHRHRIADVGDVVPFDAVEVRQARVRRSAGRAWRRRRRGCRPRPARHTVEPVARLAHTASRQHLGDLTAGVRHDAQRHTAAADIAFSAATALRDRPPPQVRVSRAVQRRRPRASTSRLGNTDAAHVRRGCTRPRMPHRCRPPILLPCPRSGRDGARSIDGSPP